MPRCQAASCLSGFWSCYKRGPIVTWCVLRMYWNMILPHGSMSNGMCPKFIRERIRLCSVLRTQVMQYYLLSRLKSLRIQPIRKATDLQV